MTFNPEPSSRLFIVIQPDPVVGMDLVEMLELAFPQSTVVLFEHLEKASVCIEASQASACILIDSSLVSDVTSADFERYAAAGARMVVIGVGNGVSFAADVVNKPFTTEMILNALI
ncbi:hypothetical protein OS190_06735 [Sulfitobacter sp. F26204]|uniref:hypothetical protein n=1 Tax=Sulfitobacter sp. F26204 TaxID=2996014 RepID=UPI00225E22B2|nr:hypothetical protein [Sulfitobacter sp. F26204]MCX7559261.1 hypothetical protein [Sulfitobacter sp. F26204]